MQVDPHSSRVRGNTSYYVCIRDICVFTDIQFRDICVIISMGNRMILSGLVSYGMYNRLHFFHFYHICVPAISNFKLDLYDLNDLQIH